MSEVPAPAAVEAAVEETPPTPAAVEEKPPWVKINGRLFKAQDSNAVLSLVDDNFETLTAVNFATALHKLATITKRRRAGRDAMLRDRRFERLLDGAMEQAPEFSPRATADVLWSSATMQHFPARMLMPVLTSVNTQLESGAFEGQHLSMVVWSL